MPTSPLEELQVSAFDAHYLEVVNPPRWTGLELASLMLEAGYQVLAALAFKLKGQGSAITHEVEILSVEAMEHTYEYAVVFRLGADQFHLLYVPGDDRRIAEIALLIEHPWL